MQSADLNYCSAPLLMCFCLCAYACMWTESSLVPEWSVPHGALLFFFLCLFLQFVSLNLRWMWWRKDWSVFLIFQWLTTISIFLLIPSRSALLRMFTSLRIATLRMFTSLRIAVMNYELISHVRLRRCFWHPWEAFSYYWAKAILLAKIIWTIFWVSLV